MFATVRTAALLSKERVALDVPVSAMRPALEEIGRLLQGRQGPTAAEIAQALWKRELYSSTTLGNGIALPHAHLRGLRTPAAAFLRTRAPIPFGAPDGQPVSQMLALLVPAGNTSLRLDLLATFVQMFSERAFREQLSRRIDTHSVWCLFEERLRE